MSCPPPFTEIGARQVELRPRATRIALLGVPVFIAGLIFTLIGLHILPAQVPTPQARVESLLIGIPLIFAGGVLPFSGRAILFDADQQRVIVTWSLGIPLRLVERHFDEFTSVLLAVHFDPESADTYTVRLKARTGKDVRISSSAQFAESRGHAEFLARFLHLDLKDESTDHGAVLSPEQAGSTLQERLRSGVLKPEQVDRPSNMRSEVAEGAAETRLEIPPGRRAAVHMALGAIIPIVIALFLAPPFVVFLRQSDTFDNFLQLGPMAIIIGAFGVVPLVIVGYMFFGRGKTTITASRSGIQIDKRGLWRTRSTLIPAEDILALDYSDFSSMLDLAAQQKGIPPPQLPEPLKAWAPSKGILIKSRYGLYTFGEDLPGAELRYLQSLLTRALAP
jgi:hypothetical protein